MTGNTAPTTSQPYVVVRGDVVRDRDAVLALWNGNLTLAADRVGKFDWFYRHAPWGTATFHLLWHQPSAAWVGTAAIGPRRMQYAGRDVRAGVLADMAVDARHRSLGPAVMLQNALVQAAADEFDLVYGFPNRAASVVMRRLGYPVLGKMPRYLRILRHRVYLERHLPRPLALPLGWLLDGARRLRDGAWRFSGRIPRAEWCEHADERVERLWQGSAPSADTLIAPRNLTWLRWRFDLFPGCGTRYLMLTAPRDEALLAWFACQPDGACMHIRDFWSIDAANGVGARWIAALVRAVRTAGFATLDLELATPQEKLANWIGQGFIEREHRFVVGRWMKEGTARPAPQNFHFTSADEDA